MGQKLETVTITDIANALKKTARGIRKRSKKQDWQPTGEKVRGGGDVYVLDQLPLTKAERKKIDLYLALKAKADGPVCVVSDDPPKKPKLEAIIDSQTLWQRYELRPQKAKDEAASKLKAIQVMVHLVAAGSGKMEAMETAAKQAGVHPLTDRKSVV